MVISHTHRYLFVEIPLTASWALRHELCELYGGEPILHKHATYPEFRRSATPDELKYFVFATVRHPMDVVVSRYFKLRSDHKQVFSDTRSVESLTADYSDLVKHQFVQRPDVDFAAFFRRYHQRPFGTLIDVASDRYGRVIRYERLEEDFSEVLGSLGIETVRPVPRTNETAGKDADWESYYDPDIREQAVRVFGPFMQKWKYRFPNSWDVKPPGWGSELEFALTNLVRNVYYRRVRYSSSRTALLMRKLRARLID